jgi:hypothetical protein
MIEFYTVYHCPKCNDCFAGRCERTFKGILSTLFKKGKKEPHLRLIKAHPIANTFDLTRYHKEICPRCQH